MILINLTYHKQKDTTNCNICSKLDRFAKLLPMVLLEIAKMHGYRWLPLQNKSAEQLPPHLLRSGNYSNKPQPSEMNHCNIVTMLAIIQFLCILQYSSCVMFITPYIYATNITFLFIVITFNQQIISLQRLKS